MPTKPSKPPDTGALYIVATPIGNLGDITQRALETLRDVDVILAEDTRHARKLLAHYGITTPTQAFHEHNETVQAPKMVDALRAGKQLALISDAGTPLVSDPGYKLVAAAQAAGVQAQTIPGASALVAAVSVAGLPTDQFCFAGFLPAKNAARETTLQTLAAVPHTVVVYESRHRIIDALKSIEVVMGASREIVIARELTKRFETVLRGEVSALRLQLEADMDQQKGEFVLLIRGAAPAAGMEADQALIPLLKVMSASQAVKVAREITGLNKKRLYQRALELDT